jgi:hypothetical protein
MLSSSVQNSEGRGDGNSGDSFADPCQEFKEGFFGVSSGLPLVLPALVAQCVKGLLPR